MWRFLKKRIRSFKERIEAWCLIRLTRPEIPQLRQYALEHCPAEIVQALRRQREGRLVLAVLGGYPFLGYVRLGYDWKAAYYNPNLVFDEVHYFQNRWTPPLVFDFGYPFFVHHFEGPDDIVRVCRAHGVSILRAYDPASGELALEAGRALSLPVIVSVH